MEIIRGLQQVTHSFPKPVVTIGNFDGVHTGHQEILSQVIQQARKREGTAIAFTFRPHPRVALQPEIHLPLLSAYDEKLEHLQRLGIDVVIEEPFSRKFSTMDAADFFSQTLIHGLSAEAVVVGYDFAFGRGRKGHIPVLEQACKQAGVQLTVVSPQRSDGEVVSSSRIRQHLLRGEIQTGNHLLGYSFYYRGIIIRGDRRGHQLGFPTANLRIEDKLVLPCGVYATWAILKGKAFPSVTNVGMRPTFYAEKTSIPLVETHLLHEDIDLYGSTLEVRFLEKLRDEQRFQGVDQLIQQIRVDSLKAEKILEKSQPPAP